MQIIQCEKPIKNNNQDEVCDRHIRLFGESLQSNLSTMTIGIVGAGGLGAILIEQIMRLYPHKIIIIDKDYVEMSNLNRLTNATLSDAHNHTPKVEVAKQAVLSNNPNQTIAVINGDFLEEENQAIFKECDIIFGASDSIAVRYAINQLVVAHGIVYIDCGTGGILENNRLKHVGGQITLINPCQNFCLYCSNLFNKQDAMSELVDEDEYNRLDNQGYMKGADIIAPQVYALNMLIASTAVWLFMRIVSGEEMDFHGIAIDAKTFSMYYWKDKDHNNSDCPICGESGTTMMGDEAELLCKNKCGTDSIPEPLEKSNMVINSLDKIESNECIETNSHCPKIILGDDNNFLLYRIFNF